MSPATLTRPPAPAITGCARDKRGAALPLGLLLPVHAIVWTIAAWLACGNLDMPGDMTENYVWGIEWQMGYVKHPPLFAWLCAAWFRVFPHLDSTYFALSALNAMAGLFGIVALAGRFLPRRLAVIAGLAMAISPFYSNLAIKFNANAMLLSIWPWTAYFFVRFMQTGSGWTALALGVFAGAAILSKYFSVVLLAALLLVALVRPAWRARLTNWRMLLAILAGFAVLLLHLHWLVVNHFPTFGYVQQKTGETLLATLSRFGIYTLAQVGYLALSFGFVVLLAGAERQRAARLMAASMLRPARYPDLWWLAFAPLLATGALAILTKTQVASVWGIAGWYAIVPLWLRAADQADIELAPKQTIRVIAGYWLIVLVATTAIGYTKALRHTNEAAEPRAELAAAAHALWQQRTGLDLPIVTGSPHEARSVAFYSDGHTRYWESTDPRNTPWLSAADLGHKGALFVCRQDDAACVTAAGTFPNAQPVSVVVGKQAWGQTLPVRHYRLFLILPQR